jgi:hypothetical protein
MMLYFTYNTLLYCIEDGGLEDISPLLISPRPSSSSSILRATKATVDVTVTFARKLLDDRDHLAVFSRIVRVPAMALDLRLDFDARFIVRVAVATARAMEDRDDEGCVNVQNIVMFAPVATQFVIGVKLHVLRTSCHRREVAVIKSLCSTSME